MTLDFRLASWWRQEEHIARILAARKMGLVKDPRGELLPDDLWRQCLPDAKAVLGDMARVNLLTLVIAASIGFITFVIGFMMGALLIISPHETWMG